MRSRVVAAPLALIAATTAMMAMARTPSPDAVDARTLPARGEARQCMSVRDAQQFQPVNDQVLMVRTGANRWFRNELRAPCPRMASFGRTIVLRASGGSVCAGEVFDVVDLQSRMTFGSCALGNFEPVERPRGVELR
jgi:hypothetical protein